ncbi:MAG: PAS-domain containing protein [Thalassovita sp.]|nr:PAS-domain containing protein [Thalassovita sp.]
MTETNTGNLAKVRSALEHIEQGITVFDENLKLVALNVRFLQLLGFPVELAEPGTEFADFMRFNAVRGEYGEGDIETLVAERVTQAAKFEPHRFERVRPDGTILRVTGTPLPGGGFVTVYSDVTSERQREAELERRVEARTEELRRNQARLALIADEVKAGIALVDENFTVKYANRRFAAAYDLTPETIQGRNSLEFLPPETLESSRPRLEKALAGEPTELDLEIDMPNGKKRFVRTFLRPEIADTGRVTGLYLLSIDMTKQKETDLTLARAQKMEALGTLSAGIAHDFNNLLTIILGNLRPLSEVLPDDSLRRDYLMPAIAAASRGNDLTTRLLSLTRQKNTVPKPLPASEAISDAIQILSSSLPSDIRLLGPECECSYWINVDRGQLEMALINLAVNSSEAISGPGEIEMGCDEIMLSAAEANQRKLSPGRYCRIMVSDTGHGMSDEVQQRIFDPFYSRKPGKGSGLGLAMVYAFVEQSGGSITVRSTPGKGTEFSLFLPAIDPEDEVMEWLEEEKLSPPELSGTTVLLVEDNALVRDVVRRQLEALGTQVIDAETAELALALLERSRHVDLVLSDISLTGRLTGIDLRERAGSRYPDLPVILMTAHGAADLATPDHRAGQVLQKPFVKQQLERSIALALTAGDT